MLKIAITGGICGGKSTMCKYIESKGYSVFYSDNIAKDLIKINSKLRKMLINEFGEETFINGKYNTKHVANIVFNDEKRLNGLDNIFKPFMDSTFDMLCRVNSDKDVIFYESALIHKHGKEKDFDYIIDAFVFGNVAIDRLMKRNNLTLDEARARMQSQINPCEISVGSNISINTGFDNWEEKVDEVLTNLL